MRNLNVIWTISETDARMNSVRFTLYCCHACWLSLSSFCDHQGFTTNPLSSNFLSAPILIFECLIREYDRARCPLFSASFLYWPTLQAHFGKIWPACCQFLSFWFSLHSKISLWYRAFKSAEPPSWMKLSTISLIDVLIQN